MWNLIFTVSLTNSSWVCYLLCFLYFFSPLSRHLVNNKNFFSSEICIHFSINVNKTSGIPCLTCPTGVCRLFALWYLYLVSFGVFCREIKGGQVDMEHFTGTERTGAQLLLNMQNSAISLLQADTPSHFPPFPRRPSVKVCPLIRLTDFCVHSQLWQQPACCCLLAATSYTVIAVH